MKQKKVLRRTVAILMMLTCAFVFAGIGAMDSHAATTKKQKGEALKSYNTSKYKVIKNKKWNYVKKFKYKKWKDGQNSTKIYYKSIRSTKGYSASFRRWMMFETDNPQSIAVTPDGSTMFIMSAHKGSKSKEHLWKGYIYRINLKGINSDPQVKAQLKRGQALEVFSCNGKRTKPLNPKSSEADYIYKKYVRVSGQMTVGHGQTLAYNPKTKKLWYIPNAKRKWGKAVMVNPDTLKQEASIDFVFKKNIKCPSVLTFDKNGNAYVYTKSYGGWAPKNTAKIYKGTITPSKVKFRLVMSGIRYAPGDIVQSIGYNPANDCLYLMSDCSIIRVPVAKLNTKKSKLKKSHIKAARFGGQREFEGIAFDNAGNGYFLVNKPDEIMQVNRGF